MVQGGAGYVLQALTDCSKNFQKHNFRGGNEARGIVYLWTGHKCATGHLVWQKYLFKAYRKPAMLHHGIYLVNGKNALNPLLKQQLRCVFCGRNVYQISPQPHQCWHYN